MNKDQWEEAVKALYYFTHADRIRVGNKMREISDNVLLGNDNFSITLEQAYRILTDTQQHLNADTVRRGGSDTDWRVMGQSNYQG